MQLLQRVKPARSCSRSVLAQLIEHFGDADDTDFEGLSAENLPAVRVRLDEDDTDGFDEDIDTILVKANLDMA